MHFLVAEDNPVNQIYIRNTLQDHGHQSTLANNGREALELLEQHDYDLVLMDIQMPVMDGLEAIRRIRALPSDKSDIPIIALTAYALPEDQDRVIKAGADGYVTKPVNFDSLADAIMGLSSEMPQQPASPDDASTLLLDQDRLMEFTQVGSTLLRELYLEFEKSSKEHVLKLETGFRDEDQKRVEQTAHSLASMAVVLGLVRLKSHARQMEQLAMAGDLKTAVTLFNSLPDLIEASLKSLQAFMGDSGKDLS